VFRFTSHGENACQLKSDLPKQSSPQFMHTRFVVRVIVGLVSFTLVFGIRETLAVLVQEAPASSGAREITIRLPDGPSVRVGGKLAGLIQEGYSALRSKRYDKANSLFSAALQANPDRNIAFFIHFHRAWAYGDKGQLDKALNDWTAAIQLNPKSATANYNRGRDYGFTRDRDKAIRDYTTTIQLDPKYLRAYVNRANEYSQKREYKLAFRDATMAIQLNPKHANAYHNRGAYYGETGDFDKSIADFSEAIRFNPRSATTFYGRALAYEDLEKFDKAIADYDRVVRIPPKDSDDYLARGSAYFKKGNYKAALSDFEKALRLSPTNDHALNGLTWVRATCPETSLRNGEEAIRMSMRACELTKWKKPGDIFALAAAYAETGDFDKAVKYQTQGMKMKSAYGPVDKKTRERLALYRDHEPWRSKPLSAR
jgi:tetratricopeptide (TPR) repeat protein